MSLGRPGRPGRIRHGARLMPQPTVRGISVVALLLVLLALALLTGTPALVPLVVALGLPVLAAPTVASARARRAAATLHLHAHAVPPVGPVGRAATLSVTVNGGGIPGWLGLEHPSLGWRRVAPDTPPGAILTPAPADTRLVAPRRLVSLGDALRTPVPTARRGVFVLPPRAVWSRDPFGLFAATALSLPAVTVVVHPAPAPDADCGRAVDAGGPHRAALAAATTNPATRDGLGDLIGLRPYVPGDRLSLLHWPARARYGTWFVRQFGTEDPTAGCLVIDDRAAVHRRRDFERLLGVALALVERAGARGETVALETVTGRTFTFLPTPAGLEQARWALAAIQPRRHGPQPGSLRGMVLTTATGSRTLVGIPPDRLVVAA